MDKKDRISNLLIKKYDFQDIEEFIDEHYQNLLSVKGNLKLFKDFVR